MLKKDLNTPKNRKKIVERLKTSSLLKAIEEDINVDDLQLLTLKEQKEKSRIQIEEIVISNNHFSYKTVT